MKKIVVGLIWLAMFCAPALLVAGCSAGPVVDEQGKSLAGVHVVAAYWIEGPYFVHDRSACVRVETMVTGADGKFSFPFFSGNFNPTNPTRKTLLAYFKAGYELLPERNKTDDPVKMRPFSGVATQRFGTGPTPGDYSAYDQHSRCPDGRVKLYPLLLAIHAEATTLAKTYKHRMWLIGNYEYLIDLPKLGEEAAKKLSFQKEAALKKEMEVTGVTE